MDEPKVQIVEVGTKKPEVPKEEPKAKETPKQLPKTSEQSKQRNTAIIALLSVVGLGGLATYLGLRKRDEK